MARSGQYSVALAGGGGFRDAAALARGLGDALQRRPPVPASSPVPVLLLLPVLEPQRGGERRVSICLSQQGKKAS